MREGGFCICNFLVTLRGVVNDRSVGQSGHQSVRSQITAVLQNGQFGYGTVTEIQLNSVPWEMVRMVRLSTSEWFGQLSVKPVL